MTVTERTRNGTTTFEAQVPRPRENGRRQPPLSKTFPSRAAAQRWHDANLQTKAKYTVNSWAEHWLREETTPHLAPASRRSYRNVVSKHLKPLGTKPLAKVTPAELTALYQQLYRTSAHATVTHVHKVARQLFKAAMDEHPNLLRSNPTDQAKLPRRRGEVHQVRTWSDSQMLAFLAYTQDHPLHNLFATAASTGMRRSEILALTPADITLDVDEPFLWVVRALHQDGTTDAPKTRNGTRRLPLNRAAQRALRDQLTTRETGPCQAPQVFLDSRGRTLSPNQVSKAFTVAAKNFVCSLDGRRTGAPLISIHGLRHSYAASMLSNKHQPVDMAIVSKLLGHGNIAITIGTYHMLTPERGAALPEPYGQGQVSA